MLVLLLEQVEVSAASASASASASAVTHTDAVLGHKVEPAPPGLLKGGGDGQID